MFRRACPGPPFGWCQGNVRFPSPPTLFPLPYDSHSPRRPISGQCGSPQAGLLVASLPVAKSQGTSPHRPAPSAKAGVSKRFNLYVLAGNLRSLSELTVYYWMASEAKGKPGHQPIGFRCGWASSLRTSEHLLVQSNKGVRCAGAPAQEHTQLAWKVPWSVQHRGISHTH